MNLLLDQGEKKILAQPVEPCEGRQTAVRVGRDFLPATQSDCSRASLYQLFIPFSKSQVLFSVPAKSASQTA